MDTMMHSATLLALSFPSLVAHQGGWDEILLVAGPMVVIVGLLAIVKRRIDARFAPAERAPRSPGDTRSGGVDGDALDAGSDSA